MTDQTQTVEQIAAGLSEAQRRIIVEFPQRETIFGRRQFVDYQAAGIRQRRTRAKLTNSGITECYVRGPVTIYAMVRLSDFGLAVRAALLEGER